jgi:excisionase family DNA binding protein
MSVALAPEDQFLTVIEAAKIMQVTPRTIYEACWRARRKKAGLPHHRIGRAVRIRYGDLLTFTRSDPTIFKRKKVAP